LLLSFFGSLRPPLSVVVGIVFSAAAASFRSASDCYSSSKVFRQRIWKLIHRIGDAGGCFRYILLEPPRRRSHQSPLPRRCWVISILFSPSFAYSSLSEVKASKRIISAVCSLKRYRTQFSTFFFFFCVWRILESKSYCNCLSLPLRFVLIPCRKTITPHVRIETYL